MTFLFSLICPSNATIWLIHHISKDFILKRFLLFFPVSFFQIFFLCLLLPFIFYVYLVFSAIYFRSCFFLSVSTPSYFCLLYFLRHSRHKQHKTDDKLSKYQHEGHFLYCACFHIYWPDVSRVSGLDVNSPEIELQLKCADRTQSGDCSSVRLTAQSDRRLDYSGRGSNDKYSGTLAKNRSVFILSAVTYAWRQFPM